MAMAQDREALERLIGEETQKLLAIKAEVGEGWETDPQVQESLRQIEKLQSALEHPDVEAEAPVLEETVVSGREYDPKPEPRPIRDDTPNVAAPDLALRGQRMGLDPSDARTALTQDRDVSRLLGQADAAEEIAQVRAKLAQQQRSPTAVHGGSANLNARFGPDSSLGAALLGQGPSGPERLRPTRTDPRADPVGIVPGDRPIRRPGDIGTKTGGTPRWDKTSTMRDSAPGEGFWAGHLYTPRMKDRVEAAKARGQINVGGGPIKINKNWSDEEIAKTISEHDSERTQQVRGSRARLREDHSQAARAKAEGMGLKPPDLYSLTQGGKPPTAGSRAHLTQARRQEKQQRGFLRAASKKEKQQRSGLGMGAGFDRSLYNQLRRTNPAAAAKMLNDHNKNVSEQSRSLAETLRLQKEMRLRTNRDRREQAEHEATTKALTEIETAPEKVEQEKQTAKDLYTDNSRIYDPDQESTGTMTGSNAQWDKTKYDRMIGLRDADEKTQHGKWDRQAYRNLKSVFDNKPYDDWFLGIGQNENSEDYADYINTDEKRKELGLPKWITRSDLLHIYTWFGTNKKFGDLDRKDLLENQDFDKDY